MKFYHFTGRLHVDGIKANGIYGGGIPFGDRTFAGQWLTKDASWDQKWASRYITCCDRTEARFTVVIPKTAKACLYRWTDFADREHADPDWLSAFNWPGFGNWYVFIGKIPPGWLRSVSWRDGAEQGALL